jgi:hypothetical protein
MAAIFPQVSTQWLAKVTSLRNCSISRHLFKRVLCAFLTWLTCTGVYLSVNVALFVAMRWPWELRAKEFLTFPAETKCPRKAKRWRTAGVIGNRQRRCHSGHGTQQALAFTFQWRPGFGLSGIGNGQNDHVAILCVIIDGGKWQFHNY